jgi:hypothetical protein
VLPHAVMPRLYLALIVARNLAPGLMDSLLLAAHPWTTMMKTYSGLAMLYAAAPCRRDPGHGAAARPAARCYTVGYSSSACTASPTSAVLALHTTGTASSRSARRIGTVQLRQPGRREKPPAPCAPIGARPDNNSPPRISCACGPRSVIPRRHRAISPPLHVQAHSLRAPLAGRTSSLTCLRTVHPGIDASTSLVRPALAAGASTV